MEKQKQIQFKNGGEPLADIFEQFSNEPTPILLSETETGQFENSPLSSYEVVLPAPNAAPNTAPQLSGQAIKKRRTAPRYETAVYETLQNVEHENAHVPQGEAVKSEGESLLSWVTFAACVLLIGYFLFELVREYEREIGIVFLIAVALFLMGKLQSTKTEKTPTELPKNEQFAKKNSGSEKTVNYHININHYEGKGGEHGI